MALDNERVADRDASDEARGRANEALREELARNKKEQVSGDEMNIPAQAGSGTPSSSQQTENNLPSSESKIELKETNAENIENIQADTFNKTTINNYYTLLDSNNYRGVNLSPLNTGKERIKPRERKPEDVELPKDPDKLRNWYRQLKINEKCFVQAMAVFQGAPEDEILHVTKLLLENFRNGKRSRKESQELPASEEYGPDDTVLENIEKWTFCQHIRHADRLFWLDTKTDEVSIFGVAIIKEINFIARRSIGYSVDRDFIKNVEEWSGRNDGEYGWRAAQVLGTIRWKENEASFKTKAEQWARSRRPSDWERSAHFIYGAYLCEYEQQSKEGEPPPFQTPDLSASRRPPYPGKKRAKWAGTAEKQKREAEKVFHKTVGAGQRQYSQVVALLEQWIPLAHMNRHSAVGLGYVVAQAYSWIGQKSLQPALDSLRDLLEYPFNEKQSIVELPILVFVAVVWSYVRLANAGYVRQVLLYLVEQIQDLSLEQRGELSNEQWERRTNGLNAFFLAFFLLVRLSLIGAQHGTYSRSLKLENLPALPDTQGRDTLLAAVLSEEEPELRDCLVQLFCAAIIEEQEDSAFELLEEWAKIALRKQEAGTRKLGQAYRQFLRDIGEMLREWCEELEDEDEEADYSEKLELYKDKLEEWIEKYEDVYPPSPIGACANDVLEQLSF